MDKCMDKLEGKQKLTEFQLECIKHKLFVLNQDAGKQMNAFAWFFTKRGGTLTNKITRLVDVCLSEDD